MDLIMKRKYKRLVKLTSIITWSSIAMFFIGFAILLIFRFGNFNVSFTVRLIIGILIMLSPFIGLNTLFFSSKYRNKLNTYKHNIEEYRIRKMFVQTYELIDSGDLKAAIEKYNKIPYGHPTREYLYPFLIHKAAECTDQELAKKGIDKINEVRRFYSPDKIKFDMK